MMSEVRAVVPLGLSEYLALFRLTLLPEFLVVLWRERVGKNNYLSTCVGWPGKKSCLKTPFLPSYKRQILWPNEKPAVPCRIQSIPWSINNTTHLKFHRHDVSLEFQYRYPEGSISKLFLPHHSAPTGWQLKINKCNGDFKKWTNEVLAINLQQHKDRQEDNSGWKECTQIPAQHQFPTFSYLGWKETSLFGKYESGKLERAEGNVVKGKRKRDLWVPMVCWLVPVLPPPILWATWEPGM